MQKPHPAIGRTQTPCTTRRSDLGNNPLWCPLLCISVLPKRGGSSQQVPSTQPRQLATDSDRTVIVGFLLQRTNCLRQPFQQSEVVNRAVSGTTSGLPCKIDTGLIHTNLRVALARCPVGSWARNADWLALIVGEPSEVLESLAYTLRYLGRGNVITFLKRDRDVFSACLESSSNPQLTKWTELPTASSQNGPRVHCLVSRPEQQSSSAPVERRGSSTCANATPAIQPGTSLATPSADAASRLERL